MSLKFHSQTPWLAPLAGFTDLPFRLLCREAGAGIACTEMVSTKGLVYSRNDKSAGSFELVETIQEDTPLVVQVFGSEAYFVAEAIKMLKDKGFKYFDLNMGCSVPKVTKTGSGAAMMKDIPNALEVAKAMIKAAGSCQVGFKMRLGWDKNQEIYTELGKKLESLGASWLSLHPRYAKQKFSGKADWSKIKKLKETVQIPIIASGDLLSAKDAFICLKESQADSLMFARGAINSPGIFTAYEGYLSVMKEKNYSLHELCQYLEERGEEKEALSHEELYVLIKRHAELAQKYTPGKAGRKGYPPALLKMRTVVPRYVRFLPGARELRQGLVHCQNWDDFNILINSFFDKN